MEDSVVDIAIKHGRDMYISGLEYAVAMIDLLGSDAREHLEVKIKEHKEILNNEAAK